MVFLMAIFTSCCYPEKSKCFSAVDCQAGSFEIFDALKRNFNRDYWTSIQRYRSDTNTSPTPTTTKSDISVGEKSLRLFSLSPLVDAQPSKSQINNSAFPLSSPTSTIQTIKHTSRKKGKTIVLTSIPYNQELEQSFEIKKKLINKAVQRRRTKKKNKKNYPQR